jgi:hypothetical protein
MLFVKSYVPDCNAIPSSFVSLPSVQLEQIGKLEQMGKDHCSLPLVGRNVIILKNPTYKGWRGQIRRVGLRRIEVAVGHPCVLVSCKNSDLAFL